MVLYISLLARATVRRSLVMALMRFSRLSLSLGQKQRKTAAEQRAFSLFFGSPNPAEPRISAEHDTSLADNSWEEQRKQRNRGGPIFTKRSQDAVPGRRLPGRPKRRGPLDLATDAEHCMDQLGASRSAALRKRHEFAGAVNLLNASEHCCSTDFYQQVSGSNRDGLTI